MSNPVPTTEIIEKAAEFQSRIAGGDMSLADWEQLERWINEDPQHLEVLESMTGIGQSLKVLGRAAGEKVVPDSMAGLMPMLDDAREVSESSRTQARGWQTWPLAIAATIVVALSVFFVYGGREAPIPESVIYETAIAERRDVSLEDGSTLELNADTRVVATLSNRDRRLVLESGELFVEVVSDIERPFRVEAGDHVVTVTGTAFNVHFRRGPARVTVDEGRVTVSATTSDWPALELEAGQTVVLDDASEPSNLSPEELQKRSAWRDGWLNFDNERLEVVVAELEPYIDKQIVLGSRRTAALTVAGSFNVDNADALLAALESVLPITVTHKGELIVIDHEDDSR